MKESIRTYSLENPIIWNENEHILLKALLKAANIIFSPKLKKELFFLINPVSGWINFERQNQLWSTFQKGVLQTPEEVKKVADDFLKRLAKESSSEEFKSKKIPPILSNSINAKIVHRSTKQVPHHDLPLIDHWMVIYSIKLKKNKTESTFYDLEGSTITIRIGFKDNIIGFSSQWRPSFLEYDVENLIHHHEEEHTTHPKETKNDPNHHSNNPTIIYELAGESEFQNKIVPYYKSTESHHADYSPASPTAFVISLIEALTPQEENEILIQIMGGSGAFAYSVYAFKPDEVFEAGCFKITDGIYKESESIIYLPKGAYNLIVWVADVQTGFIKKFEQSIYSFPIIEEETINPIIA